MRVITTSMIRVPVRSSLSLHTGNATWRFTIFRRADHFTVIDDYYPGMFFRNQMRDLAIIFAFSSLLPGSFTTQASHIRHPISFSQRAFTYKV